MVQNDVTDKQMTSSNYYAYLSQKLPRVSVSKTVRSIHFNDQTHFKRTSTKAQLYTLILPKSVDLNSSDVEMNS